VVRTPPKIAPCSRLGRIALVAIALAGTSESQSDAAPESISLESAPAIGDRPYHEPLRPQFHFTARQNWLNDPNGLVFFHGEYHLFFQRNPDGNHWGNMTWGHAISHDLVHWQELDDAITPDARGTIFSGSAVVDWHNSAGLQSGLEPALLAFYTAAGGTSPESKGVLFTQCLAYSNDRGRTWTKYRKNPVIPHFVVENRDPKVFWHEPTKHWIMALYLDGNDFALFRSLDLKRWERTDKVTVPGSIECPDLFELSVEGDAGDSKWVFWTANNVYVVGDFDGTKFTPTDKPQRFEFGANRFAAQTFSDIPSADGRRLQIAWMRGGRYPEMKFNQQMTFPTALTLHATSAGYRLRSLPVAEVEMLRGEPFEWKGELSDQSNPLEKFVSDACEMKLTATLNAEGRIILDARGEHLAYNAKSEELSLGDSKARVPLSDGKLMLRILVDRTSIEVFANEGVASISNCFLSKAADPPYRLSGNGAIIESLTAWPLNSAWEDRQD
jgi:fructan beta-fructosidase